MDVGDYLESTNAEPGAMQKTIDTMISLGGLGPDAERICEIGAGSGRYAAKLIEKLQPEHYEFYEAATDWLPYLLVSANVAARRDQAGRPFSGSHGDCIRGPGARPQGVSCSSRSPPSSAICRR